MEERNNFRKKIKGALDKGNSSNPNSTRTENLDRSLNLIPAKSLSREFEHRPDLRLTLAPKRDLNARRAHIMDLLVNWCLSAPRGPFRQEFLRCLFFSGTSLCPLKRIPPFLQLVRRGSFWRFQELSCMLVFCF